MRWWGWVIVIGLAVVALNIDAGSAATTIGAGIGELLRGALGFFSGFGQGVAVG